MAKVKGFNLKVPRNKGAKLRSSRKTSTPSSLMGYGIVGSKPKNKSAVTMGHSAGKVARTGGSNA